MTEPAVLPRTEPELDSTTRADQSDELATTTLLRAAIGPVNTDYYLGIFTRFDARDRVGPSWNNAAALSTLNWMLYRKMWNAALAYSGVALTVALLVFGIGKLAFHFSSEVQWALAGLYTLTLVALPGFFGNALLFKQYRKDMARALSAHHTLTEAAAMLLARAPTRRRLIGLGSLNALAMAALGALALWAATFEGMSSALNAPPALPAPVASGNVAMGRAVEAATAATRHSAAASAPAPQASASAPAVVASAAASTASAPVPSAPPQPVTAPANAGRGNTHPPSAVAPRPADAASAPTARKKAEPSTAAATPGPATEHPRAAVPRPPGKPAAPVPSSASDASAKPGVPVGSFGINVGVFANDNNARNAFVKLSDAGLPAYTEESHGKKGKFTRVRVGPFDSAAQAEKTAEKIRALNLDAEVFKQLPRP